MEDTEKITSFNYIEKNKCVIALRADGTLWTFSIDNHEWKKFPAFPKE